MTALYRERTTTAIEKENMKKLITTLVLLSACSANTASSVSIERNVCMPFQTFGVIAHYIENNTGTCGNLSDELFQLNMKKDQPDCHVVSSTVDGCTSYNAVQCIKVLNGVSCTIDADSNITWSGVTQGQLASGQFDTTIVCSNGERCHSLYGVTITRAQ